MEAALKSSNMKNEIQAPVVDALVQTDMIAREDEACQTEKSIGIDCEVQTNPKRRTFSTQTIKAEKNDIAIPNLPSSSSSKIVEKSKISSSKTPSQKNSRIESPSSPTDSNEAKKRKIASIQNPTDRVTISIAKLQSILHNPKQFTRMNDDNPVHLCTFLKVKNIKIHDSK